MAVVVMGGVPRQPALVPTDTALAAGWWLWLLGGRRASKTRAQKIGGARITARACDARGKTRALDALQEPPANMRPRRPLCPGVCLLWGAPAEHACRARFGYPKA